MSKQGGLLDGIWGACRIQEESGVSFDEALIVWSQRQNIVLDELITTDELNHAAEFIGAINESNVIPFRAKH